MMALGLQIIRAISDYPIRQSVINHLALVATIALQVTLFFLLALLGIVLVLAPTTWLLVRERRIVVGELGDG